jgi:putative transcriptional regulator
MNNRVKKYRTELNLTQAELSEKLGVSRQTVNAIENGRYNPSTALSLKLGIILKKKVEEIFFLEDSD